MPLQISLEQARALGILPRDGFPVGAVAFAPARVRTAAALALEAALAPRRSAKGGRHARLPGASIEEVSFTVDHPPRTKHRARTQISKRAIERAFMEARGDLRRFSALLAAIPHRSFTPRSTEDFERRVSEAAREAMGGRDPIRVPVEVEVRFVYEGDAGTWPTDVTDADLDNLEKAVLDGLSKVAYADDRLVVRKGGLKECGPVPGVRVRILRLPA